MKREEESLEYEQMKKKDLEQLRSGKSLYGKDGAFAPLLKSFLNAALEAEVESHLDEAECSSGNRKNGKTTKDVRTSDGTITINTPRDRNSSFEPELIRKRETILAESLESKIIGSTLSAITDKIIPEVKERAIKAAGRALYDCLAGCHALQGQRRSSNGIACGL